MKKLALAAIIAAIVGTSGVTVVPSDADAGVFRKLERQFRHKVVNRAKKDLRNGVRLPGRVLQDPRKYAMRAKCIAVLKTRMPWPAAVAVCNRRIQ
jgi:hypothetical protein